MTQATKAQAEEISKNNSPKNDVVQALQVQVANAFVLYLNYKHYHWQTFGPLFRDVHLLFDELATETLETVDEMAERIRMIGQSPVSHLDEFTKMATVSPAKKGTDMRGMIKEADENLIIVIKEMREGVKVADEGDDPGTADVFTRFVQIHEKYEWWLRDMLEKKDGLTA